MLTVASLLWEPNAESEPFSRMYSEAWVERLYRGFARNLSVPFRFLCFTDRERSFNEPLIEQDVDPTLGHGGYADCIRPYRMGTPMILVGLDTVITGNIDHLAGYCMGSDRIALPRDPYQPQIACNGVALVPGGRDEIATRHCGENDMAWVRRFPHAIIDDLWPGHVISFKGAGEPRRLRDERIVYFHGDRKPHQLADVPWVSEHWR